MNSKQPGDIPYPQDAIIRTVVIGNSPIIKGRLYTKTDDANHHLVAATVDRGFTNGIFQALETIPEAVTGDRIQTLTETSKIILPAKTPGLGVDQRVSYDHTSYNVESWKASSDDTGQTKDYIGTVYEILNKYGIAKLEQANSGDNVIVSLGA